MNGSACCLCIRRESPASKGDSGCCHVLVTVGICFRNWVETEKLSGFWMRTSVRVEGVILPSELSMQQKSEQQHQTIPENSNKNAGHARTTGIVVRDGSH